MVDPNSHTPVYQQIVEHIHGAVAAGLYRPDEMLPSIRALSLQLLVNPNTVQRAYQELERQGVVYTRKGLGIFVARNGEASAQSRSEAALSGRLAEAIRVARAAGLSSERIDELFQNVLRSEADSAGSAGSAGGQEVAP